MLEISQYGKHWYFLGYCSMGDTGHVGDITVWKTLVFFYRNHVFVVLSVLVFISNQAFSV